MFLDWVSDVAPYLDRYSILFGISVFFLAITGIVLLSGSAAIALVSAVTAFVAIYRLRRPDKATQPAVRQSFITTEQSDLMDFGLHNYGPGPALYLQFEVTTASTGKTVLAIGPRDPPIHLAEGEFVGFIHDKRISDHGLIDEINDVEEEPDEMINLYYSYVSSTGVREPEGLSVEMERDDKYICPDLKNESEKPRRMEMAKIRSYCITTENDHPPADTITTQ